jgi:5-methylthioribose kinase
VVQIYEVEALRRVRAWLPADSVVTVPEVHLFDEEAHAIVMDDTGLGSINFKAFMQQGGPSLTMAKKIGESIGVFLGRLHKWGQGNKELCAAVKGNTQAKALSGWAYYGRLKDTLTGAAQVPFLSDPPLDVAESDLTVIDRLAEETTRSMLQVEDSVSLYCYFWRL